MRNETKKAVERLLDETGIGENPWLWAAITSPVMQGLLSEERDHFVDYPETILNNCKCAGIDLSKRDLAAVMEAIKELIPKLEKDKDERERYHELKRLYDEWIMEAGQ